MKLFVFELICAGGLGPETPSSLRKEGWAMLSALVEDFDRVDHVETLTLLDQSCLRPLGRFCRRIGPGEERDGFQDTLAQADMVLVIAPEFNQLLAERAGWVVDAGRPLLGSSLAAIDLTGDKLALARHLAKHGIRTPAATLVKEDGSPGGTTCTFPAVCKPRHGAGSLAMLLVHNQTDISRHMAKTRVALPTADFLLQRFVPGRAASVTFLIGPNQRLALLPAAQHLSNDGRFHYLGGSLPLAAPLARRARELGQRAIDSVPGLAGLVGVDLVLGEVEDGSQDWLIEINPRPTTSYIGLRQLAQENLARALLRITRGQKIAPIAWRQGEVRFSTAVSGR